MSCYNHVLFLIGSFRLPLGKKVHVFISHGTSDQKWVREYLISGLRSHRSNIKVQASYHCMPDHTCYNNKDIRSLMRGCCVIVICISAGYLGSNRYEYQNPPCDIVVQCRVIMQLYIPPPVINSS